MFQGKGTSMERNTTGSGIKYDLPEDYKETNKVEVTGVIYRTPKYKEISPDKNGRPRHMYSFMLKTKWLGFEYVNMFSPKAEVTATKGFCEGDMVTVFGYLSKMKPKIEGGNYELKITATSVVPLTGVQSIRVDELAKELQAQAEITKEQEFTPTIGSPVESTEDEDVIPF